VTLFPTVETSAASSLRRSCLVARIGCWGRKARCLVVLSLILVSSLLVALAVLLLLRDCLCTAVEAVVDVGALEGDSG
jgi:diacylglycerol kinase